MKITVDSQNAYRVWPHVEKYQNTTLRYTPAPDFPPVLEKTIGRPSIIRLFITLDEVWDYRDNSFHWDYPIGVNPYVDDKNHYPYDWPLTVPSPVNAHIKEYLTSHAAVAEEVLLNIRRYEREVTDGLISFDQYEHVFEKVVEYYKNLCPNIVYIECCNEVELVQFGNLSIKEYYRLYQCAYRAIRKLNVKNDYPMPLKIGGFGMACGIDHWSYWVEFLQMLRNDENRVLDFYSMHEYHTNPSRIMEFCMKHQEMIHTLGLPNLPLLMTEYGLRVGIGDAGRPTNIQNAAGEIPGMILGSYYPNLKMFPWCTFHNPNQQIGRTMFILNSDNEYIPTPSGHTMTMFSMLGDQELMMEEFTENKAIATVRENEICLLASNPGVHEDTFDIKIKNLKNGQYTVVQYLVNEHTNNCLTDPTSKRLNAISNIIIDVNDNHLDISENMSVNSFCLWVLNKID